MPTCSCKTRRPVHAYLITQKVQFLPIANYIKDDMKTPKLVIHLARHIPTGAEIPMIVNSIKDNTITTTENLWKSGRIYYFHVAKPMGFV